MNVECDRTHMVQLRGVYISSVLVLRLMVAMTRMPSYHPITVHQARQTNMATT